MSQRQERRRQEGRRRQPQRRAPLPEAKRELLVSVDIGEQRVAVLEDGAVAEVYLERPERRSIAGNIYFGVVDNVLPGMEAAFVEIGLEKNGFLYVDEIVVPELEGRHHGRKIQDLISKGQTILVQAVKDPMKSKGARLTTQISLPGRFVVFVPQGEGLGVSRRLNDDERQRLKDILKNLNVKEGGVIVRTAAEGASAEDIERDLVFLQRLWKSIQSRAKETKPPSLVYQEAELPLRVTRDLFTGDFEHAYVDNDQAYKRIVGYLKKTSPHMVERVTRYKEKTPMMEAYGVDKEVRSTLDRRVDLPSGGYLIFDYAEAFTVIDVNTGRFVGGRGKNSNSRLEDTITKNNLEAVKEVVRQLRLRDIGGIIVIDFIDMANPKNRQTVEEALRAELERDRTKTYVVEISPLGLVEMTRQNVTDGPREVMTRKCPTCGGDGIVISEHTAAIEIERKLRALAAGSRCQAFKVELATKTAAILIGGGAGRLTELEKQTKRRFMLVGREDVHSDHFLMLEEGSVAKLAASAPFAEGDEVRVELAEVDRHDVNAAVGKADGHAISVGDAAGLVGKKVKVRIERVLDGTAYATVVETAAAKKAHGLAPLTAEGEAEKPTRKPPVRKGAGTSEEAKAKLASDDLEEIAAVADGELAVEAAEAVEAPAPETDADAAPTPKKRTRRGSRGGRKRKKAGATASGEVRPDEPSPDGATATPDGAGPDGAGPEIDPASQSSASQSSASESQPSQVQVSPSHVSEPQPQPESSETPAVRIHVPDDAFGRDGEPDDEPVVESGAQTQTDPSAEENATPSDGRDPVAKPKKRTRRGSRGGKGRNRKAAASPSAAANGKAVEAEASMELAEPPAANGAEPDADEGSDASYVPMSEWIEDFDRTRDR